MVLSLSDMQFDGECAKSEPSPCRDPGRGHGLLLSTRAGSTARHRLPCTSFVLHGHGCAPSPRGAEGAPARAGQGQGGPEPEAHDKTTDDERAVDVATSMLLTRTVRAHGGRANHCLAAAVSRAPPLCPRRAHNPATRQLLGTPADSLVS